MCENILRYISKRMKISWDVKNIFKRKKILWDVEFLLLWRNKYQVIFYHLFVSWWFMIQYSTFAYNNDLSSSQDELNNSNKKVIKIVDVLGREIHTNNKKITLIHIYNDGSIEKVITMD